MRVSVACVAVLVALGLASCSSDDGGASPAPRSSSAAPSSASTDPSPASSSPASPSVAPAVGKRHAQFGFSFVLPSGFRQSDGTSLSAQYVDEEVGMIIIAGQVPALGSPTVDEAAALDLDGETDYTRQPDRVVGGQPVYVLTQPAKKLGDTVDYRLGRGVANRTLDLTFTYAPVITTDAAATALIESILATVQWDE